MWRVIVSKTPNTRNSSHDNDNQRGLDAPGEPVNNSICSASSFLKQ